jgi:uncharacterized Zn finger protein
MNVKKGSKNAIENRGLTIVLKCLKCGTVKKSIKVVNGKSSKFGYECSCGIFDKWGISLV